MNRRESQVLLEQIRGADGASSDLTIAEAAVFKLWDGVISGSLPGGVTYTAEGLAEVIGADPISLREAVVRLEYTGLISRFPDGVVQISPISYTELQYLFTAREDLEGLFAAHVAGKVRDGVIAAITRLEELHERFERLAQAQVGMASDQLGIDFHDELKSLCGNPYLTRMHDQLMLALERCRRLCRNSNRPSHLVAAEHSLVLDRIWAGDPDGAREAMREHDILLHQHFLEHMPMTSREGGDHHPYSESIGANP